jgi:hypothetical protein
MAAFFGRGNQQAAIAAETDQAGVPKRVQMERQGRRGQAKAVFGRVLRALTDTFAQLCAA